MALNSMTGFARSEGSYKDCNWSWEVKSVNGRGLDVRCRLPQGMEGFEQKLRAAAAKRFSRGNLNVFLQFTRAESEGGYRVNRVLLDQLISLMAELDGRVEAAPPRMDGLLAVRGVIEQVEPTETAEERGAREAAMLASLDQAFAGLAANRAEEGARLHDVLSGQVDEIERLTSAAGDCAALRPENIARRLKEQVQALVDSGVGLSEERLAQELALLATKADVSEEIDRLKGHVEAARDLLKGEGAGGVGRSLDFLTQEFNREANTLCSKSGNKDLTAIGLELKVVIDRFREQIQNIE